MHSELRDRIQAMQARLDGRTPVAEIRASSQLFVTPDPVCRQMADLAELNDSDRILEPEAGTGPFYGPSGRWPRWHGVTPWSLTPR